MTTAPEVMYERIGRPDLEAVMALCGAQGYSSFTQDPEVTWQAFTNPGVTTLVARHGSAVVGVAQVLSDGVVQAFLALLLVAPEARGSGIGRGLIERAFAQAGGRRLDLLAEDDATGFYERFHHRRKPGFRLYPEPPAG